MNQPTSLCYHESLAEEMGLFTTDNHTQGLFDRNMFGGEGVDVPGVDDDEDIDMAVPQSPVADNEDIEMDVPRSPAAHDDIPHPPFDTPNESQHGQSPGVGRFVETYEGCAETFPGGETFIGRFRNDQYTEQR